MINVHHSPWSLGLPSSFGPLPSVSPIDGPLASSLDRVTLGSDLAGTSDFLNQVANLRSLARRQQAVADLGSSPSLPANWDTMPLGDFLTEMARLRSSLGPSRSQPSQDKKKERGGQAAFGVNAHRYWDSSKGEYVEVKKVQIHEKGNWAKKEPTTWNSGSSKEVSTQKKDAELGKVYQVTVTWEDGTTRTWDYTNSGQTVDVWGPNH